MLEGGARDEITDTFDVEGGVSRYLKRYAGDGNILSRLRDAGAGRLSNAAGILPVIGAQAMFGAFLLSLLSIRTGRRRTRRVRRLCLRALPRNRGRARVPEDACVNDTRAENETLRRHSPPKRAFRTPARTRSPRRVLRPWRRAASRGFPQTDRSGRAAFAAVVPARTLRIALVRIDGAGGWPHSDTYETWRVRAVGIRGFSAAPLHVENRCVSGSRRAVFRRGVVWSGRAGSNRRHSAWEADVLPLNYARERRKPKAAHTRRQARNGRCSNSHFGPWRSGGSVAVAPGGQRQSPK